MFQNFLMDEGSGHREREQWSTSCWVLWLAPAGLRGGMKLEAHHQSRQPQSFFLCGPRCSGTSDRCSGRCGVTWASCCGSGNQVLYRRCGVLLPGSALRDGSMHVLALRIVVPEALRRPSGRLLRQRHSNALQTLRRLLGQLSRQRQPLVADLSILDSSIFFSSSSSYCASLQLRATQSHPNWMPSFWQRATLFRHLRKQAMAKSNTTKSLKRPFVGRGETWPPVLALGCLSGLRGLSVWSFVLLSASLFPRRFCGVVFLGCGVRPVPCSFPATFWDPAGSCFSAA